MKKSYKKSNQDIDEQKEGISYEKGLEFEREFAQFLKSELKWTKVRVGASISGHNNPKGTSIDVIGERLDALGIRYKDISTKWLIGSGICFVGALIWYIESWMNNGLWLTIYALLCIMGGSIFRILSDANNKQNAWVECKNLKSKVNINHISKMIREFQDYKATKDDQHRFTHYYFASANGYVENALKMAHDNNIVCYTKIGNSFVEEKYWNQ